MHDGSSQSKRGHPGKTPPQHVAGLSDAAVRADAIARTAPFSAWPRDALLRLAAVASPSSHVAGTTLIGAAQRCVNITIVATGTVIASVSSSGGRRVVFKLEDSPCVYGLEDRTFKRPFSSPWHPGHSPRPSTRAYRSLMVAQEC